MYVIKVNNNFSFLQTDDVEVKGKLWSALRVPELNYYNNVLYKRKLWDGYTEYFKKDTGRFLTGLMSEVTDALKYWGIQYSIVDQRPKPVEFTRTSIDENFLPGITLIDYQVEYTNTILQHRRGIIKAPTGAGKSYILVSLIKCLPPKTPTLVLVNTTTLTGQNYKALVDAGIKNVGRIYDKYNDPNYITCCTIQSLHKLEDAVPKISAIFVDEVHANMSKAPKKWYVKANSASIRVALSATPFKFDGRDKSQKMATKGHFGPLMKINSTIDGVTTKNAITTKQLQDRGILSRSKCKFYRITEPELLYEIYSDAVTNGIVNNYQMHDIVKKLACSLPGRTLIIVERLAHGDILHGLIPGSLWIAGKDDQDSRMFVIDKLKKTSRGNAVGIATSGILNAGIDVHLHNLVNAAGGKAEHQIIQRMGRGLRTADDKSILNYFDFFFENNEYLEKHSKLRVKILKREGHDVVIEDSYEN